MSCIKCGHRLQARTMFCPKCRKEIERVLVKDGAPALSAIITKEIDEFTHQTKQKYEHLQMMVADDTVSKYSESRQSILRKIKFHEDEFERVSLSMSMHEVEGHTRIGIFANGHRIGSVPKGQTQYILDNWERIDRITGIEIFGGNKSLNTQKYSSFGAEIKIRMLKQGALTKYTDNQTIQSSQEAAVISAHG